MSRACREATHPSRHFTGSKPIAEIGREFVQFERVGDPHAFWKGAALLINTRFTSSKAISARDCFGELPNTASR
jgi:hypothetical protein